MSPFLRGWLPCILCVLAAGCAFAPKEHWSLDQARRDFARLRADPQSAVLAPREVAAAAEALALAEAARDTLDDPATIDHLSYLARQRVAIARETAAQRRPER